MQKINFTNGHHLDINTMEYIQDAYSEPIEALAKATHLQNYILSGMEKTENGVIVTVADGWVVLDGEPMAFVGGSYNGNDEQAESYVVKRTETAYNMNANGQSVPAFTKKYATLGAYESGAVDISILSRYRQKNRISLPDTLGLVSLAEGVQLVDTNSEALKYGFCGVSQTPPRFWLNKNSVSIRGVFKTQSTSNLTVALGTIPGWPGVESGYIKAELYFTWGTEETVYKQPGRATIGADGILTVLNETGQDTYAVVFDCTPTLII